MRFKLKCAWLFLSASQDFAAVTPSFAGGDIDEDKVGVVSGFEDQGLFDIGAGLIVGGELVSVDGQRAVEEIQEDPATVGSLENEFLFSVQVAAIDRRIGVEGDGVGYSLAGGNGEEPVFPLAGVVGFLIVGGPEAGLVGEDPDLAEVDRLCGEVELGVRQAGTGGHPLDISGPDDGLVAHAVLVGDLAVENNGDNFHFLVGVCGEAGPGLDDIVIEDPQGPELDIGGVEVAGKREKPIGLQPAEIGEMTVRRFDDRNHGYS